MACQAQVPTLPNPQPQKKEKKTEMAKFRAMGLQAPPTLLFPSKLNGHEKLSVIL